MRLVLPGQEALEMLERAGTTQDECTVRLKQILAQEHVQFCVFGTRVSEERISLQYMMILDSREHLASHTT
jgi:hypothetical protein